MSAMFGGNGRNDSSSSAEAPQKHQGQQHYPQTHGQTQDGSQQNPYNAGAQSQLQAPKQSQAQQSGQDKPHQKSQSDQDKDDDKARKKAEEQLVSSWMDRLQLISVITTFFAANEAQMLSFTTPNSDPDSSTAVNKTCNAMLTGALILHSFSAIIAFLGAFVLVRFKLKEAKKDEHKAQDDAPQGNDKEKQAPPPYSTNPHLERVGYFAGRKPPTHLLYRVHSVAIIAAIVGFIFGVVGVICFAWSQQARPVGIFSSACIGICLIVTIYLLGPFEMAEKQT